MTKVSEHIGIRGMGATRVDVDIEVKSPDGERALAALTALQQAVEEAEIEEVIER